MPSTNYDVSLTPRLLTWTRLRTGHSQISFNFLNPLPMSSGASHAGYLHKILNHLHFNSCFTIEPLVDNIWSMMIVWRIRRRLSRLFCAVLCTAFVGNDTRTWAVLEVDCWFRFRFAFVSFLPTSVAQRSEVDVFSGVCLFVCQFVCQHNNFWIIKHRIVKRGGYLHCTKSRPSSNFGVIGPTPGSLHRKCGGLLSLYAKNQQTDVGMAVSHATIFISK